jgi:F0F1-type ATP synthase assembly protein I
VKPWIFYTLVRIGLFAGVFAVLYAVGFQPWLAAVIAAVIGLCVSYLFLRKTRDQVASDLYDRRHANADERSDEEAE